MCDPDTVSLTRGMATFFSLPIELRNIIYSMILILFRNIKICSLPSKYLWDRKGHSRPRYRERSGQLLLVNKQAIDFFTPLVEEGYLVISKRQSHTKTFYICARPRLSVISQQLTG